MLSRNQFYIITISISLIIASLILIGAMNATDNAFILGLAFLVTLGTSAVTGRMAAEIWNTVRDNRARFIGVYPISFIESNVGRRLLLVLVAPLIMLCNAIWYFVPVATGLKSLIFERGFWEANASAIITTWRRQVSRSDLAGVYGVDYHDRY